VQCQTKPPTKQLLEDCDWIWRWSLKMGSLPLQCPHLFTPDYLKWICKFTSFRSKTFSWSSLEMRGTKKSEQNHHSFHTQFTPLAIDLRSGGASGHQEFLHWETTLMSNRLQYMPKFEVKIVDWVIIRWLDATVNQMLVE
jgi:hypothetical protein